jgi:hypothetical protein
MRLTKLAILRAVAIGLFAGAVLFIAGVKLLRQRILADQVGSFRPPPVLGLKRVVTISTSPKGWCSFVSVEPETATQPLEAAFVIQYKQPLSSAIAFHGPARITAENDEVRVEPTQGSGWLFEFPSLTSFIPTRLTRVPSVTGIGSYRGNTSRTHEGFVRFILSATPDAECR